MSPPPTAADLASHLVGAWRLVHAEVGFSDGRPSALPFGPSATGRIIYTSGGAMSAVLMAGPRPGFSSSLETSARALEADKAAAFDGYLSYSGYWTVDATDDGGHCVVHEVDMALVPAVVGELLRRRATFRGPDDLRLTYDRTPPSGVIRHFRLDWRRDSSRPSSI